MMIIKSFQDHVSVPYGHNASTYNVSWARSWAQNGFDLGSSGLSTRRLGVWTGLSVVAPAIVATGQADLLGDGK